jgi:ubiquinone/menaquinone biosynthesis C-methylase UbiE
MASVKKYFDEVAESYATKSGQGIWALLRRLESVAVMKAMIPIQGMTCVELGCGAGFYANLLVSYNPSLFVAIDISEKMLVALDDSRVKRVRADVENIQFNMTFDRVLCAGVIEFLSDIKSFISNIKKLLSVSGKAILLIPQKGVAGRLYKAFHRLHSIQISIYSIDELKNLLDVNHLKIEVLYTPTPMTHIIVVTHS